MKKLLITGLVGLGLIVEANASESDILNHMENDINNNIKKPANKAKSSDTMMFYFSASNVQFKNVPDQEEQVGCTTTCVGTYDYISTNYLLGTAGVILYPDSYNINISYTGQLGSDVFYGTDYSDHRIPDQDYILKDEGSSDIVWIDIYTKPLKSNYGEIGFGYTYISMPKEYILGTDDSTALKLLDMSNSMNGALEVQRAYSRLTTITSQYYFTYNLPRQDAWYDGFGLYYQYEISNALQMIAPGSVAISPDSRTHLFGIGFNKTIDEVNNGLSFKVLNVGKGYSTYLYHDYSLSEDTSSSEELLFYNAEIIYKNDLFNTVNYYATVKWEERYEKYSARMQIAASVGLLF